MRAMLRWAGYRMLHHPCTMNSIIFSLDFFPLCVTLNCEQKAFANIALNSLHMVGGIAFILLG